MLIGEELSEQEKGFTMEMRCKHASINDIAAALMVPEKVICTFLQAPQNFGKKKKQSGCLPKLSAVHSCRLLRETHKN